MKIVQKNNKQLKIQDDQLKDFLSRGFSEVDQKTGKVIIKKDAKAEELTALRKENAELKKENKELKDQLEAQAKAAH